MINKFVAVGLIAVIVFVVASSVGLSPVSMRLVPTHPIVESRAEDAPPVLLLRTSSGTTDVPFFVRSNELHVVSNRSTGETVAVAKVDAAGMLVVPDFIEDVVVEIGTNDEPEMTTIVAASRSTLLIAFEPRPDAFRDMRAKFPHALMKQLVAIPAAVSNVAPTFLDMNVGGHRGCSSLLPMSKAMHHLAVKQKKAARKKSQTVQLRTVEYCTMLDSIVSVPTMRIGDILSRVPPRLNIQILMTDAQGFDTSVISSLPTSLAARVPIIVMECQDVHPTDQSMLLTEGALTCAEQRECFQSWFPHRVQFCWFNAQKIRELNCLYSLAPLNATTLADQKRVLPKGFKIVGSTFGITYPPRPNSQCPHRPDS